MPHEVRVRGFSELSEGLALDFVEPLPGELTCTSCGDLVGILWLSPSCQHHFCTHCLEVLLGQASKSTCPVDQAEIFRGQLVEDTSVQDKASQFQVWCSNRNQGCTVTPRICDLRGSASELEAHENDWQQHRRLIVTRLAEYRRNLEDIQGERDMLRNQVNEVNAALKGLNLGFEHHCGQTTGMQNEFRHRMQQVEQRVAQLESQGMAPQHLSSASGTLRPSAPSNFESIGFSNQMSMAPTEASMSSMAPPGLSASNDEVVTRPDGQFRWLLKEYSRSKRHQRHGTHRYASSPIFCTGVPGYRLQLRVHLNGMGQSRKGRFMAVQLVLLRGPNDSELPWPFRHRVTVALVNQTGPPHISYTINDPSFPRPQGDHTVPYVWQEFVAISDLEASPGLAWNDSLLFELSVTAPSPPPPGLYPPL
ncbi:uncharacterized protein LOC144100857 isoform X2 [Amblyomma americanum]